MTRWAALCVGVLACVGHAAPVRLVLSIGNDVGQAGDEPLRYAETDARRVKELFVELGAVKAADATVLTRSTAADVEAALEQLTVKAASLGAQQRDVMIVVYVSSHAAAGALHLGESELLLTTLRDAVARIPAALRLLVVDACSSGALVRRKGGQRTNPSVNLGATTTRGTVVITSSGPVEAAQEWDQLTSSLFTHHWLAGLRGRADASGDGRVTLNEAYAYAYAETVAAAAQHPSYDLDLAGSGDVVLTEPRRASSAVELTPSLDGRFVVLGEDPVSVFLEFDKRAGAPLRLALPPGRYRVRRTLSSGTQLAQLSLPEGGLSSLGPDDFGVEAAPVFARKGRPGGLWSLAVEVSASASPSAASKLVVGPGVWVKWQSDALWVSLGGCVGVGASGAAESLFALQSAVGARFEAGPLRLGFGVLARPTLLITTQTHGALEMGVQGTVEAAVAGPFFFGLSLEGLARLLPVDPQAGGPLGWRAGVLAGNRF